MPSKDQDPAGYGPITVLTFAILSKRSLQIRGMMPVWVGVPIIVYDFPDPILK